MIQPNSEAAMAMERKSPRNSPRNATKTSPLKKPPRSISPPRKRVTGPVETNVRRSTTLNEPLPLAWFGRTAKSGQEPVKRIGSSSGPTRAKPEKLSRLASTTSSVRTKSPPVKKEAPPTPPLQAPRGRAEKSDRLASTNLSVRTKSSPVKKEALPTPPLQAEKPDRLASTLSSTSRTKSSPAPAKSDSTPPPAPRHATLSALEGLDPMAPKPQSTPTKPVPEMPRSMSPLRKILKGFEENPEMTAPVQNNLLGEIRRRTVSVKKNTSFAKTTTSFARKNADSVSSHIIKNDSILFFHSDNSSNLDSDNDEIKQVVIHSKNQKNTPKECPLARHRQESFVFQHTKAKAFLGCRVSMNRKVTMIADGGAAAACGIRVGDILLGSSNTLFHTPDEFVRFVSALTAGETVILRVNRKGITLSLKMCVGVQADGVTLSKSDEIARALFIRKANTTRLENILSDTKTFATCLRRSYDLVDTAFSGRVSLEGFRDVVEKFTNGIGVSAPVTKDVDESFALVDAVKSGFLTIQECATACHLCFHSLLEDTAVVDDPEINPLSYLK